MSSARCLSGLWLNGMSKRDQITAIFILEREVIEEVSNQSLNSGGGASREGLNREGGQRERDVCRETGAVLEMGERRSELVKRQRARVGAWQGRQAGASGPCGKHQWVGKWRGGVWLTLLKSLWPRGEELTVSQVKDKAVSGVLPRDPL